MERAKFTLPPPDALSGVQMRVAPTVQLVVRIPHGLGAGLAQHHLEVHRLQALVDVAVDDAGRAGDTFPRPEAYVEPPARLVLDERSEVALQHEEHLLDLVRVRGVPLPGLDVHDGE